MSMDNQRVMFRRKDGWIRLEVRDSRHMPTYVCTAERDPWRPVDMLEDLLAKAPLRYREFEMRPARLDERCMADYVYDEV